MSLIVLALSAVAFGGAPVAPAPAPAPVAPAPAASGSLDGRVFTIDIMDPGTKDKHTENVTFAAGTFHSAECDQYGFAVSAYTATTEGGAVKFVSDAKSPTEGLNHWTGTVTGTTIQGDLLWTKPGQAPILYPYTGAEKKAP